MLDLDTFVTWLYVMVDHFCASRLEPERPCRGHRPSLCRSEVVTLALVGQWGQFGSERSSYALMTRHPRSASPHLPRRSQFNRLMRQHQSTTTLYAVALGHALVEPEDDHELLDCTSAGVRNVKRRGQSRLSDQAAIGVSNRPGWFFGFRVLLSVTQAGVVAGFGFSPANTQERHLADTFFALRTTIHPPLLSVGQTLADEYLADGAFAGALCEGRWVDVCDAVVRAPPHRKADTSWPRALRRWHAGTRQIAETINHRLLFTFALDHDRPHSLSGFATRVATKDVCIAINTHPGRPPLACGHASPSPRQQSLRITMRCPAFPAYRDAPRCHPGQRSLAPIRCDR